MSIDQRNLVLTGFMGTGKTATGHKLAGRLRREFVDTDGVIAERAGMGIPEIFSRLGESAFRDYERQVAVDLSERSGLVISTGGRMLLDPHSAHALGSSGDIVCLTATVDTLVHRLLGGKTASTRPLLVGSDPRQKMEQLLAERQAGYSQFPQVATDRLKIGEAANAVQDWLLRRQIYRQLGELGTAPTRRDINASYGRFAQDILNRLHDQHAIVLDTKHEEIVMALPFSAAPTEFAVVAGDQQWWANCAWDSLAIPAALGIDAQIQAVWDDTHEPLSLSITNGELTETDGFVHFSIPAHRWWVDIAET